MGNRFRDLMRFISWNWIYAHNQSMCLHMCGSLCINGYVYFGGVQGRAGFILWMRPTTERRRYIVTTSLIGWALRHDVTIKCRLTLPGRIHKTIPGYVLSSLIVYARTQNDLWWHNSHNPLGLNVTKPAFEYHFSRSYSLIMITFW